MKLPYRPTRSSDKQGDHRRETPSVNDIPSPKHTRPNAHAPLTLIPDVRCRTLAYFRFLFRLGFT